MGCRYCLIMSTRLPSSSARITTAPGCETEIRVRLFPEGVATLSSRTVSSHTLCRTLDISTFRRLGAGSSTVLTLCLPLASARSCRRPRAGACPGGGFRGTGAGEGGGDQAGEQRGRAGRPGQELRVRLGGDEKRVRVAGQFDELHQAVVRRQAREDQTGLLKALPVGVVDLVAVPVALLYYRGAAVEAADDRALLQARRVQAEAHGAA